MRFIKLGIISLVFFAVIITLISLFFPSRVRISKAIDLNSNRETVLAELRDPARWKKWYPGGDTASLYQVNGETRGIATSPEHALVITSATDSSVTAKMEGKNTQDATSGWMIYENGVPNSVTLQWFMDFHLRWYPWEKFSSLLLEKRYGPLMEKGLSNLQTLLGK